MDLLYPSSSSSACRTSSRTMTIVALATAVSVVSIVLSVALWEQVRLKVNFDRQAGWDKTEGSDDLCLPCNSVVDKASSLDDQLWYDVFFKDRGFGSRSAQARDGGKEDENLCCAQGRNQLRLILRMFLNVRSRKETVTDEGAEDRKGCVVDFPSTETSSNGTRCLLNDKVGDTEAAHVFQTGSVPPRDGMLSWTDSSVMHGRVESINGRLKTEFAGIYFVYSQVYFVDYGDDKSAVSEVVKVSINRHIFRSGQEVSVCERTEMRCSLATLVSAGLCEYSVYTGSLVEMESGDCLSVSVSHPGMVNDDAKLTYFGLHRVT